MGNAIRGERSTAGGDQHALIADSNLSRAVHHDVEFVLTRMRVHRMLLPGLETIQSRKQLHALYQRGFTHFLRRKLCSRRNIGNDHKESVTFGRYTEEKCEG